MDDLNLEELLQQYYPKYTWRVGQRDIVEQILAGHDVLALMPTGSGKSLCYQLPSLVMPGMTLVISPLIALMQDQVSALRAQGISAAYLNRSLDSQEYRYVLWRIGRADYDLLYIAPERLQSPRFWRLMQEVPISMVAVDEAHCISLWGHDFRPDYLRIHDFIQSLPHRPVIAAFTATASGPTQADIVKQLGMHDCKRYCQSFDRPNLYLGVVYKRNKLKYLLEYLSRHSHSSGIIYCATRKSVDELSYRLNKADFKARAYHAGMRDDERRNSQAAFISGECSLMVATNAFGMGIDKADVGFVIHYQLPLSVDAYYQEVGRAGRDGNPADCLLLYDENDQSLGRFLIDQSVPAEEQLSWHETKRIRQAKYRQLELMDGYARYRGCLRSYILNYFGEESPGQCGNCSVCSGHPEQNGRWQVISRWLKRPSMN